MFYFSSYFVELYVHPKKKHVSYMEMASKCVVVRVKIPQNHTEKVHWMIVSDCPFQVKLRFVWMASEDEQTNALLLFSEYTANHFGETVERKINLWPFITRRKSNRNSCAFHKTINPKRCFCNKALNCTIPKPNKGKNFANYQKWCFSCRLASKNVLTMLILILFIFVLSKNDIV